MCCGWGRCRGIGRYGGCGTPHQGRRWAFSLSKASAVYALFGKDLAALSEVDWNAVAARDFRPAPIKEGKQAEFLVHERFPWRLVNRIGVHSAATRVRAVEMLGQAAHRPVVEALPDWYY